MAADSSTPAPHLSPHIGHRRLPHPSLQALAARVPRAAAEPRPTERPDTSRQEDGGRREATAGERGRRADKLGKALPLHPPPHDGGGNAASTSPGRGRRRTPEAGTADNAEKSPRHKTPRIATRKHYLRQEMTLGCSGGNCPSHLSILTVSAPPREIGPASLHPQAPELHCGCAGSGVGAAVPPCPEVRCSCEVPQGLCCDWPVGTFWNLPSPPPLIPLTFLGFP